MLLRVENLHTHFVGHDGVVPAVTGVSLDVDRGQTVALVGESGCGKSVTALSILRLVQPVAGRVIFQEQDLLKLPERQMRAVRGNRIAMVFQEPMASLNPVLTVGAQIEEALRLHRGLRGRAARQRVVELLRLVGVPAPDQRRRQYPHELSGGLQQRVLIAMALACEPELLIADEPTTALDVTLQAQILDLLRSVQARTGMAILLITHDLGVVAEIADAVCVMYAGRIVERGPVRQVLATPGHPYTQGLLRCTPRLAAPGNGTAAKTSRRLAVIPGEVPDPRRRPAGCPFHPRCELGRDDALCRTEEPRQRELGLGQACACWKARAPAADHQAGSHAG